MTRLWPEGLPIDVQAIDGQPASFRWEGRRHAVRGVVDRWTIHDEWWREGQEVWRRYYQVQTVDGLCASVRRIPSAASRSMFGVGAFASAL